MWEAASVEIASPGLDIGCHNDGVYGGVAGQAIVIIHTVSGGEHGGWNSSESWWQWLRDSGHIVREGNS